MFVQPIFFIIDVNYHCCLLFSRGAGEEGGAGQVVLSGVTPLLVSLCLWRISVKEVEWQCERTSGLIFPLLLVT